MSKKPITDPRKSPRQARAKATVDALLEAGARILTADGYERANVNRIAELAGVSVGSLYQYFPTKDALVAAVIKRHSEQMTETFEKDLGDLATLPTPLAVRAIVRRALVTYSINPKLRKVVREEVPRGETFARTEDFDARLAKVLEGYFAFHAANVRPSNHALAVKLLMTAVESIAARFAIEDPEQLANDEVIDEIAILVLRYFWIEH